MANLKFTLKRNNAGTYDELYPKTVVAQVDGLQSALDAKLDDSQLGAVNGVASLDGSGKIPFSQLPSSVTGGMRFYNTADLSAGTSGSPIELSTLWSAIANHSNFSTTGGQSVGSYIIVTGTGWVKDTNSVTGTSSGYFFYTPNGTPLGEEGDNTTPYQLEKGDWIVMRSAYVPAANVTAYTFAVINNTYQNATQFSPGIVSLAQTSSLQDWTYDGTSALTPSEVAQFFVGGDQNGATLDGIALSGHTHSNYQPVDPELTTLASLSTADGNIIVGNGTTWVVESGSTARTSLGLAIGTNVQAYDPGLESIAGLTTTADRMLYTTASDTYAVTTLTSFARSILDDADAAAVRTTINAQNASGNLTQIAGLSVADGNFIVGNGTNWTVESGATARASLGVYSTTQVDAFFTNRPEIYYNTTTGAGDTDLIIADVVAV
jgi:hypothetical protein